MTIGSTQRSIEIRHRFEKQSALVSDWIGIGTDLKKWYRCILFKIHSQSIHETLLITSPSDTWSTTSFITITASFSNDLTQIFNQTCLSAFSAASPVGNVCLNWITVLNIIVNGCLFFRSCDVFVSESGNNITHISSRAAEMKTNEVLFYYLGLIYFISDIIIIRGHAPKGPSYCFHWRSSSSSCSSVSRKSMAAHRTACWKVVKFDTLIEDSIILTTASLEVYLKSPAPPLLQSFTHVYANNF